MERKNILVFGSSSSGKSSFIRLVLGKYAIGESRDFYSHHGTIADNYPVNIVECPAARDDQAASYYNNLEKIISGLETAVHHVVVVVKYTHLGFNAFKLNRNNLPHRELECLRQIVGGSLQNPGFVTVVVSNWSRQFGRIAERRERGITEEVVRNKVKDDIGYALGVSALSIHFMDTVFWRTEQKNNMVPNTLPTTLETLEELVQAIAKHPEPKKLSQLPSSNSSPRLPDKVGYNTGGYLTGNSGYNPGSGRSGYSSSSTITANSGYNPGVKPRAGVSGYSTTTASTMTANSGYTSGYNASQSGYNPGSRISSMPDKSSYIPRVPQPQGTPKAPTKSSNQLGPPSRHFTRGSYANSSAHGSVTETIDVDKYCSSQPSSSDDEEEMQNKMKTGERWRNKKYQDLSHVDLANRNKKSAIDIPISNNTRLDNGQTSVYFDGLGTERAVPVKVIPTYGSESSLDSYSIPVYTTQDGNNNNAGRRNVELSDVVESKVKELVGREGVVIDMKDNKMTGKIITKTTILQEVKNSRGETQFVENEETDERYFGSELETISNTSFSQADKKPIFSVGQPIRSNTFEKKQKEDFKRFEIPIQVEQQRPEIPIYADHGRYESRNSRYPESKPARPPSSVSSSSHSSDETIEVVETIISHEEPDPERDLANLHSTIVLLGTEPNLSHIYNFVKNHKAQDVICCVRDSSLKMRYDDLLSRLKDGDHLIFIWAVENKTGDFSQQMVHMFADFIEIFSPASINSMIVVLWHPGSTTDIKASVENMTYMFEQSIEYNTSIGFPVLHFKPIPRFYSTLLDKLLITPPVKFIERIPDCYSPLEPRVEIVPQSGGDSDRTVKDGRSSSSSSSTTTVEDANEVVVETVVEPPVQEEQLAQVLVLLSPPGHGKSSVGNLIMGDGHFQVRGTQVSNKEIIQVKSGRMFDNRSNMTILEFPGLYEDGIDKLAVQEMEAQLRQIGYLSLLVIVWDALEWRNEDLDFVLTCVYNVFGTAALKQLLFTVTFWDNDVKSKKERRKRKITPTYLENMIQAKVDFIFKSEVDVPILFVSAEYSDDVSRYELSNFLCNTKKEYLDTRTINSFLPGLELLPEILPDSAEQDKVSDNRVAENGFSDYEYIERNSTLRQSSQSGNIVENRNSYNGIDAANRNSYNGDTATRDSFNNNAGPSKSKSVHNISIENSEAAEQSGNMQPRKKVGGSLFSIQGPNRTLPRNSSNQNKKDPSPRRGRARGNLMKKRSMSSGSVFNLGGGGNRARSPREPQFIQQKSVDNIYVDEEEQQQLAQQSQQLADESIMQDSSYNEGQGQGVQSPQYAEARSSAQTRGRRRVISGSSSLSMFSNRSRKTSNPGSDTQTGRRSRSRLRNSMARSASGSRGNQAGSAANMNRTEPDASSPDGDVNQDLEPGRQEPGIRNQNRGSLGPRSKYRSGSRQRINASRENIGGGGRPAPGLRGRSRSRQNLAGNGQPPPRRSKSAGTLGRQQQQHKPGDCTIL